MSPRVTRLGHWLLAPERRGTLTIAICVIVATGVVYGQSVRANGVEAKARRVAATISYQNSLKACEREIPVREATRANAQAIQLAFGILGGFFKGARGRAAAQSRDPNISVRSRTAAKASLVSIDAAITAFSVKLSIPPPPLPCIEVIDDPNTPARPHHS